MSLLRGVASEAAACAVVLAAIGGVLWAVGAYSCAVRWEGSGMASKYAVGAGCVVKVPDGRWLPDGSIRDIPIPPPGAASGPQAQP